MKISIKLFLWLTLIVGIIYPLIVTGIGFLFMNHQAHGSMITRDGKIVGSSLIGQKFTHEAYFWPRPSANDYNALQSGGSNLSPSSLTLKEAIEKRRTAIGAGNIPNELLFASGSGLDPHISVETAYFQIDRILKARGVDLNNGRLALKQLINDMGIFYVNVLELNIALDDKYSNSSPRPRDPAPPR